jgi:type IV pilus assembly protein PilB
MSQPNVTNPAAFEKGKRLDEMKNFERKISRIKRQEEENEAKRLAEKLNLPYIKLDLLPVDAKDLAILEKEKSEKGNILVIRKIGKTLQVAVKNPGDPNTKQIIEELQKQGFECKLVIVSSSSLIKKRSYYEMIDLEVASLKDDFVIQEKELKEFEQSLKTIQELKKTIINFSTTRLLTIIMAGAIKMGASDVHFEPSKDIIRLRYRIDGLLQDIAVFPAKAYRFSLSRVKTLSSMLLNVHDISQDGRFTIKIMDQEELVKSIDIRVSILPSSFGESIVMRLLDSEAVQLNLPNLGFRPESFKKVESQIIRPNGMILTTGPTGSGKTTTLYACLNYINKSETKIITVEDPIEYKLKGITQTQVSKRKGQTFAKTLKTVVRQDPDALMVGEIRDAESAQIAVQSALTGHLVFSTVHTNDSAGAIPRLTEMGIKPFLIPASLNLVIAQRLVRRLCPYCKEPYEPSPEMIESAKKIFSLISAKSGVDIPKKISKFYKAKGCEKCNGLGYKGRIGIFELFTINDTIEKLILKQATSYELRAKAMEEGMLTLMQDSMLRVIEGITSLEEVQRVIGYPQYIEQLYGESIMSMLSRALVIDREIFEWSQSLTFNKDEIQKKLIAAKMENLIKWIVAVSIKLKATDIHFETAETSFTVRLRIDGSLEKIAEIPKELFLPTISYVKELAGMKVDVHQKAQDGRFKIECPDKQIYDTRVSVIPSGYGESVIIRLLRSDIAIISLKELGVRPELLKDLEKVIKSPNGIIFVTGPTSAGKTTTLYSILNKLNQPETKIFTIEDPIEYRLPGVIQTQINKEEGYTFFEALRALLRQNPNIIMLGEIRDPETAQSAIQASLTGHLVLTTLHTNSAAEAIQRLTNLKIRSGDISSSIKAIVAQRLVKKLCPYCKKEAEIEPEALEKIKKELKQMPAPYQKQIKKIKIYKPGKCRKCNQKGYQGQIGIFEILITNQEIKKEILASASPTQIEETAKKNGMLTLYQDGLLKALEGKTTLEEVERVAG